MNLKIFEAWSLALSDWNWVTRILGWTKYKMKQHNSNENFNHLDYTNRLKKRLMYVMDLSYGPTMAHNSYGKHYSPYIIFCSSMYNYIPQCGTISRWHFPQIPKVIFLNKGFFLWFVTLEIHNSWKTQFLKHKNTLSCLNFWKISNIVSSFSITWFEFPNYIGNYIWQFWFQPLKIT